LAISAMAVTSVGVMEASPLRFVVAAKWSAEQLSAGSRVVAMFRVGR
jgi:hypothetical protein